MNTRRKRYGEEKTQGMEKLGGRLDAILLRRLPCTRRPVDAGVRKGAEGFAGGTLRWLCASDPMLKDKGLEPYDCLSPTLMDLLAINAAKAKGTCRAA